MESKAVQEIIRDAHYPFSLTRFASPVAATQPPHDGEFSRFLQGLDTLEELVILNDPLCEIANDTAIGEISPQSLPRLRSVSANLENLTTLVPGRPVSRVSMQSAAPSLPEYDTLAATLSRSLTPIDSLDVSSGHHWIYLLLSSPDGLFAAMHRHSIRPKHLTINMTLSAKHLEQPISEWDDVHFFDYLYQNLLIELAYLELDEFHRLETLKITQRSGSTAWMETKTNSIDQQRWAFEIMKQSCPLLRVLSLFGVVIQD
ncbi:hypothetical protein FRC08_001391 [Ceratobasidium sp. 394]|nr:hypothetical protein FRC08_001391 [Ceratobasidium sp. 394]